MKPRRKRLIFHFVFIASLCLAAPRLAHADDDWRKKARKEQYEADRKALDQDYEARKKALKLEYQDWLKAEEQRGDGDRWSDSHERRRWRKERERRREAAEQDRDDERNSEPDDRPYGEEEE